MRKDILPKVFGWMFLGLLITFITGYTVSLNSNMLENIFANKTYLIIVIVEIALAIFLSSRINKMSRKTATCTYLFYTFITGLTFSSIFIVYKMETIIYVFLVASLLFGIFSLIGKFTKIDLTKISIYLFMGLIGVLILSFINIAIQNETLNTLTASLGLFVFLGYTAYDIQRIVKNDYYGIEERNIAIIGAFNLYLDFINIFIDLLNLFGDTSD